MEKTAVLFSGGFDSAAAVLRSLDQRFDLLFVDYHQEYMLNEFEAARRFAIHFNLKISFRHFCGSTDMPERNLRFLDLAKNEGYEKVIVGIRNPTPLFDIFGDSNYFTIKKYAKKIGIKVKFPVLCWPKYFVFKILHEYRYVNLYNCYNNKNSCWDCTCVNCLQLRRYWKVLH